MSDVFRNLLSIGLAASTYIGRNDATRNALFGYMLGRLQITGGDANDIQCGLLHPQGFTALQDGASAWLIPGLNNTGPVTLNVQGIGAVPLRDGNGNALSGGELVADQVVMLGFHDVPGEPEFRIVLSGAVTPPNASVNVQIFDTSGSWIKPAGSYYYHVRLIGAGGGGGSANNGGGGGGANGKDKFFTPEEIIEDVVSITIGAGGPVNTNGGDSLFGSYLTAYGGGRAATAGGGGGGDDAAGQGTTGTTGGNGGGPNGGAGAASSSASPGGDSTNGGGGGGPGGSVGRGGDSINGGGGGGSFNGGRGGDSVDGGGGGGGGNSGGIGGSSRNAGRGGNSGQPGQAPGGGGGRNAAGANGRCIVTSFIMS